jgi:HSP20 family protein
MPCSARGFSRQQREFRAIAARPAGAPGRASTTPRACYDPRSMNWDPLHELLALHERTARRVSPQDSGWMPNVDLLETEAAFVIVAELPGFGPDDFAITATADGLTLSGQRAPVEGTTRYLRMERGQGRFTRSFVFGEPVSANDIRASFDEGVLTVTVPKHAPQKRRISIG